MEWKILDTGASSAHENMETDRRLLAELTTPVLHLFEFEAESATFGHFIEPFEHLREEGVKKRNLQLARRPTGGGIIFHLWDFTFSLLIPSTHPAYSLKPLDNYARVNQWVSKALKSHKLTFLEEHTENSPFCMARPTIYDIMLDGKKVGGCAQRRTKEGFLHQASLSLAPPSREYLEDLLPEKVIDEMERQSSHLSLDKREIKKILMDSIRLLKSPLF